MLAPMARILLRSPIVRNIVGGLGAAVLAGLGWKLGSDLYDVLKRKLRRGAEQDPPAEPVRGAEDEAPPAN